MLIAQAVLTALLSGLFSGAVIFALNERRDRQKLLLDKAEAATEAYVEWIDEISNWPILHFRNFDADRDAGREEVNEHWKLAHRKYRKARLLIGAYLPSHLKVVDSVHVEVQAFARNLPRWANASVNGEPMPPDMAKAINESCERIVQQGTEGFSTLIAAVGSQANSPHLVRIPWFGRAKK